MSKAMLKKAMSWRKIVPEDETPGRRSYWLTSTEAQEMRATLSSMGKEQHVAAVRGHSQAMQLKQKTWTILIELMTSTNQNAKEKHEAELFRYLNDHPKRQELMYQSGPVGDLPLHQVFLLGLKETGMRLYDAFYVDRINSAYSSDLHAWHNETVLNIPQEMDDGGLYTGETILHIGIVQRDAELVKWILSKGGSITARATGAFFKPRRMATFVGGAISGADNESSVSNKVSKISRSERFVAWVQNRNLRQESRGFSTRDNPFSACPYGEFPLSFAASVGAVDMLPLLLDSADDLQQSDYNKFVDQQYLIRISLRDRTPVADAQHRREHIINAQDSSGNTALHMAVMHNRPAALDWLLDHAQHFTRKPLEILNADGLTPFTLAASMGHRDLFYHILHKHMRSTAWQYGAVQMTMMSLEQVDSFLIEGKPLHEQNGWRSALEVIVEQEVEEFANDELFNRLIREKWEKFARWKYLRHTLIPYMVILALFSYTVIIRCEEIRNDWTILKEAQNSTVVEQEGMADSVSDIVNSFDLNSDEDRPLSELVALISHMILVIIGSPWLIMKGWRQRRLRLRDLDPHGTGQWQMNDFVFKNLHLLLHFLMAAFLIFTGIFRVAGRLSLELDGWAVTGIWIWCGFLVLILPFEFFGGIIITTYRMMVSDIVQFLFVYIIVTIGFSSSLFVLFRRSKEEGIEPMDQLGTAFLSMIFVGLDDTDAYDLITVSRNSSLALAVHLVYVIMITILLLNLIIAMMAQTFIRDTEDIHRIWIFPFASMVLRQERRLTKQDNAEARYRYGKVGGSQFLLTDKLNAQVFYEIDVSKDKAIMQEQAQAVKYQKQNGGLLVELGKSVHEHEKSITDGMHSAASKVDERLASTKARIATELQDLKQCLSEFLSQKSGQSQQADSSELGAQTSQPPLQALDDVESKDKDATEGSQPRIPGRMQPTVPPSDPKLRQAPPALMIPKSPEAPKIEVLKGLPTGSWIDKGMNGNHFHSAEDTASFRSSVPDAETGKQANGIDYRFANGGSKKSNGTSIKLNPLGLDVMGRIANPELRAIGLKPLKPLPKQTFSPDQTPHRTPFSSHPPTQCNSPLAGYRPNLDVVPSSNESVSYDSSEDLRGQGIRGI